MLDGPENSVGAESTSTSILDRARLHQRDAWEKLVSIYGPLIYEWCRRHHLQPADAADVMQEVFRAVLRGIHEFHRGSSGGSFRGWLWAITRNKIADHFRSRNAGAEAGGGTDALGRLLQIPDREPETSTDASPRAAGESPIHRALALVRVHFEDRTWQAFWRVAVDGHRTSDVAADLGISVNAVRKAKSRVLQRFRDEFGDLVE